MCLDGGLTFAHHSVAVNFDQSKSVDVTGKIKEVLIRNPHSQITLLVSRPDGSVAVALVASNTTATAISTLITTSRSNRSPRRQANRRAVAQNVICITVKS